MSRYEGKIAWVSAGGSGIGAAVVERLSDEGATVLFLDIADDRAVALEAAWRERGRDVHYRHCDVTDEAQVAASVAAAVERFGRIDVAMNVAGGQGADDHLGVPLHETPLGGWHGTFEKSLTATFLGMKHQIAAMLESGGGAIGNVTSMVGVGVSPHSTYAYAAAKAGVVHLTRMAAVLYAAQGIRVNVIAPGLTATPALVALPAEALDGIVQAFHPTGRLVPPASQAAALAWLCSDDAADVTGLTVPVDGGWSAR